MNVLLLLAHSIEEYDQVRLLSSFGYDVFSIGAYSDPAHPGDTMRPPLPEAPRHPELEEACRAKRDQHAADDPHQITGDGVRNVVDWAKYDLPDAVFDWADTIIVHHFEHTWLVPQWCRLREKRVIWRTVGQSVEGNERMMAPLVADGLQVVRYSPKERHIPGYAGEDALIRFYKDPAEWCGWTGEDARVINITQRLRQRDPFTNWRAWEQITSGLPRLALGPGSEEIGGPGALTFDEMQAALRRARCYLYTGTQPASYTLGLIEAMMTGCPVVSIGPEWMQVFPYGTLLFEGHEICKQPAEINDLRRLIEIMLEWPSFAFGYGDATRDRAIELFGMETIGRQWAEFLG